MKSISLTSPLVIVGVVLATGLAAGGYALATRQTAPAATLTHVTIQGKLACLPHKGNGPATTECAYGVKTPAGTYYGLTNLPPAAHSTSFDKTVKLIGTYKAPAAESLYNTAGTINVTGFQSL
jgi:hypothetical protein